MEIDPPYGLKVASWDEEGFPAENLRELLSPLRVCPVTGSEECCG